MATATRTNKEVVQRTFDALNERDRTAFVGAHSPDAVVHVGNEQVRGIDTIVQMEFAYFDSFPDLTLTLDALVAEDAMVAARWTVAGTHRGTYSGIEPTGTAVEFEVIGMFRVEDELVREVWIVPDQLGLLQQLGATELPDP